MRITNLNTYVVTKRLLDLAVATTVYFVTLPIQAIVAILILLDQGKPVLFRQDRPGLNGEIFILLKFRTMKNAADNASDDNRITPLGSFLRSTSLDEIPTLINVIRGDMSLVGPRPLLPGYLSLYSPQQARRHQVKPGVTGLAQVNGRNLLSWEDKFRLDVLYVEQRSMKLDIYILWKTLWTVLRRNGIASPGHATTPEFEGRQHERDL